MALVKRLWKQVFSEYGDSEEFLAQLRGFKQFLEQLIHQFPGQDYLVQSLKRAEEMIQRLNSYPVKYESLERLSLSMMGDEYDQTRQIQLKLMFLLEVLVNKNDVSQLSSDEKQLMALAMEILKKTSEMQSEMSDENVARGFLKQMIGPLSYTRVKDQFPADDNSMDAMDWKRLTEALRAGNLNDLLFMSQTKPYLRLRDQKLNVPKINEEFTGRVVEFSEADRDIESADDLDRWKHFLLSGGPAEFDMFTFLSDDMLEFALRDPVETADPINQVPRKVTIILADVSGSMSENNRYVIRNSLVAGYVDHAARENLSGEADHMVLYVPFDGTPHDGETLKEPGEFKDFFQRILNASPGGGASTSITKALVHAFQKIFEHQESGGPFARASVLLVTDGADTIDINAVAEEQAKVSSETEIFLNGITIDKGNPALEEYVSQSSTESESGYSNASYFHITLNDINSMLNSAAHIEAIESYSRTFDLRLENAVGNSRILDIRRLLVGIERDQKRAAESQELDKRALDQLLRQSPELVERTHDENVLVDTVRPWIQNAWTLPVSGSWSPVLKSGFVRALMKTLDGVISGSGQLVLDALSKEELQKLRAWAL